MPGLAVDDFVEELYQDLRLIFRQVPVRREWRAELGRCFYSPRVDVAVGPFAVGNRQFGAIYDEMSSTYAPLLHCLYSADAGNAEELGEGTESRSGGSRASGNHNARCFFAIEIENRVSRKHLMGGALNASALGRVGIVIGWTPEKVRALLRLRAYLRFLARVGKPFFPVENLVILSPSQLLNALGKQL